MNESQFRNLLQHKRDRLSHHDNQKSILPAVDSIFDNKDLVRKINLVKASLLSQTKVKKTSSTLESPADTNILINKTLVKKAS